MPSSYTALGFEKQAAGEHLNTWGSTYLNNTIDRINYAVAGYQAVTVANGTNTLTSSNTSTAQSDFQARNSLLKLTGSPTANFTVIVPATPMVWSSIWNATSYTATISTGSGTTIAVEAGDKIPVECLDGTNITSISYGAYNLKDYIAAQVLASSTSYPAIVGNAGKYLYTDGASALWRQPSTSDLSDYQTLVLGVQVALAVAL